MDFILLTQSTGLIGSVAKLLGYIMNAIFFVIDKIGLPNVGLAIILFTIVVNLLMLPLTIKQQKFSKLSAKMNPEIQAINDGQESGDPDGLREVRRICQRKLCTADNTDAYSVRIVPGYSGHAGIRYQDRKYLPRSGR